MKFKGSGEIKVLRLSSMPVWDVTKALAGRYCIATWHLDAVPFIPPSFT